MARGLQNQNAANGGIAPLIVRDSGAFPKNRRLDLLAPAGEVHTEQDAGLENWQIARPCDPANPFILAHDQAAGLPRGGWGSWGHAVPAVAFTSRDVRPLRTQPGLGLDDPGAFPNAREQADFDFLASEVEWLQGPWRRKMAKGTEGVIVGSTGHGDNSLLAVPAGGPLVADHEGDSYGTPVFSVRDGALDRGKTGSLSSVLRIAGYPGTCFGPSGGYGVALNMGNAGGPEYFSGASQGYGFAVFSARPVRRNGATGRYAPERSPEIGVAAFLSYQAGGPLCPLSPNDSKFTFGQNADGMNVNSAGLHVDSIFSAMRRDREGKLDFNLFKRHRKGSVYRFASAVWLCMDEESEEWGWACGQRPGKWKWHTTVPYYEIATDVFGTVTNRVLETEKTVIGEPGPPGQQGPPGRDGNGRSVTIQFLGEVGASSFEITGDPIGDNNQDKTPGESKYNGPITGGGHKSQPRGMGTTTGGNGSRSTIPSEGDTDYSYRTRPYGATELPAVARGLAKRGKKEGADAEEGDEGGTTVREGSKYSSNKEKQDANREALRKRKEEREREDFERRWPKEQEKRRKAEERRRRKEARERERQERREAAKRGETGSAWGGFHRAKKEAEESAFRRRMRRAGANLYANAYSGNGEAFDGQAFQLQLICNQPLLGHIKAVGEVTSNYGAYNWTQEPIINPDRGTVIQRGTADGIVALASGEVATTNDLFISDASRSCITYLVHDQCKWGLGIADDGGADVACGTVMERKADYGILTKTYDDDALQTYDAYHQTDATTTAQSTAIPLSSVSVVIPDAHRGFVHDYLDVSTTLDVGDEGAYFDVIDLCGCA